MLYGWICYSHRQYSAVVYRGGRSVICNIQLGLRVIVRATVRVCGRLQKFASGEIMGEGCRCRISIGKKKSPEGVPSASWAKCVA